jgi:hypothetical protein
MKKNFIFLIALSLCFYFSACEDKQVTSKENDEQELIALFNKIKSLSAQVSCENDSDWKFVAYGNKACGGPTGFIAYSSKIDIIAFLKIVDQYNNKQREFNIKWSVYSDCSIISPPKSIICENGKPKFVN